MRLNLSEIGTLAIEIQEWFAENSKCKERPSKCKECPDDITLTEAYDGNLGCKILIQTNQCKRFGWYDTKIGLININKQFHDGSIRYDGILDNLSGKSIMEIAKIVASQHPFFDGNKRTAIKFLEIHLGKRVPEFVYELLAQV